MVSHYTSTTTKARHQIRWLSHLTAGSEYARLCGTIFTVKAVLYSLLLSLVATLTARLSNGLFPLRRWWTHNRPGGLCNCAQVESWEAIRVTMPLQLMFEPFAKHQVSVAVRRTKRLLSRTHMMLFWFHFTGAVQPPKEWPSQNVPGPIATHPRSPRHRKQSELQ